MVAFHSSSDMAARSTCKMQDQMQKGISFCSSFHIARLGGNNIRRFDLHQQARLLWTLTLKLLKFVGLSASSASGVVLVFCRLFV